MEIRVLGPVEVVDGDRTVPLPAAKERMLLGALAANVNQVVAIDRLIDALWGDRPPRSANKTLQTYVLHLRRVVGDRIVTRAPGYALEMDAGDVDAVAFERAISASHLAILRGDSAEGAELLERALRTWRGDPYEGFDSLLFATEAVRLTELKLAAIEDAIQARLDHERPAVLVSELEALVAANPLRERLWGLLMHALYRDGRQGDALRAYQRARVILANELGVEPSQMLRDIESAVLHHDPALDSHLELPASLYAMTPDGLRIGYWVRGEGPPDVVLCAEWVFNLDLLWDLPGVRPFLERLSRGARLIVVQRRGTGVSDRDDDRSFAPPTDCVADIDAVLDALGCGQVSLLGWGHGGQVALVYAARRRERVSSLAIVNGYARLSAAADYDAGVSKDAVERFLAFMEQVWGTDAPPVPILGPVVSMDPRVRTQSARLNRLVATPREAVAIQRAVLDFDVRGVLGDVRVPALVVHLENSITGEPNSRWLAEHLPTAEYMQLPGWFLPTADEARTLADRLINFVRRPSVAH